MLSKKTLVFRIIYEIIFRHSWAPVSYNVYCDILMHVAYYYITRLSYETVLLNYWTILLEKNAKKKLLNKKNQTFP